jgi:hypothetical protein
MIILGGNQRKAERIARDLVKDLTLADIDTTVDEGIGLAGEQRLCAAVDDDFMKNERRLEWLDKTILTAVSGEVEKLFDEYGDLRVTVCAARQKASFLLGYASALRLLGVDHLKLGIKQKR